jgi:hypothetical protein
MRTAPKTANGVNLLDAFEGFAIAVAGAAGIAIVLLLAPDGDEEARNVRLGSVVVLAVPTIWGLLRAIWLWSAWAVSVGVALWRSWRLHRPEGERQP